MQTPGLDWHRASLCQTGECVEIATYHDDDGVIVMRSSARPESGYLYFTRDEFSSFLRIAKAGRFDLARPSVER